MPKIFEIGLAVQKLWWKPWEAHSWQACVNMDGCGNTQIKTKYEKQKPKMLRI
jgi:hypothetical protein